MRITWFLGIGCQEGGDEVINKTPFSFSHSTSLYSGLLSFIAETGVIVVADEVQGQVWL